MGSQEQAIRSVRFEARIQQRIEAAVKEGGFTSRSAFIRSAVEHELAGRESGVNAAEERIAASLDRLAARV